MQDKEYKVFKVTVNYSENDQKPANHVELIEFPSDVDAKNAILHHLLQSYRTTKDKNRGLSFDEINNATESQTTTQKIRLLQATAFKKTKNSDEAASKGQEFLVIQSSLSQKAFFESRAHAVANRMANANSKISDSNFWLHRSTWMSVTMLLSAILLVLAFTVALPVMEVLMPIFLVLLFVSTLITFFKAFFDFGSFLFSSNYFFERVADWIKNNPAQTIIASVGVGLSLVGLGALIGLFPIIGPALTLACGCSLFIYAFVLAVFGPTTIADAINRYLDVRQAENVLEDFKDEKQITLVPVNKPQGSTGSKVLKAIFSKDVDKNREDENNARLETEGDPVKIKVSRPIV